MGKIVFSRLADQYESENDKGDVPLKKLKTVLASFYIYSSTRIKIITALQTLPPSSSSKCLPDHWNNVSHFIVLPLKYKEGNNRPSSVNQIPLVHNHDKAGNKYYTPRKHEHSGKPMCENRCLGKVNFTWCGHVPAVQSRA